MRFVLADANLVVAGRVYEGFPLLIDDDGDAIQPAQNWLWDLLGRSGRISSKKTWENYGRAIYDFFGFVLANDYDWKTPAAPGMPGAIEAWGRFVFVVKSDGRRSSTGVGVACQAIDFIGFPVDFFDRRLRAQKRARFQPPVPVFGVVCDGRISLA